MRVRHLAPLGCLLVVGCDDHLLGVPPEGAEAPPAYTCDWVGVQEFFGDYCQSCHSGANPSGGFDLVTTIEAELGGGEPYYVVPGDPDASRLWQALAGIGSATLMPYGYTIPLDLSQTEHVQCWISEGAPL